MFCLTRSRTLASLETARFGNARHLEFRVLHADMRVEPAAGRSDGIRRDERIRREIVFLAILFDRGLDRIHQLLRGRSQIGAARVGGVVARAGGRWPWVKIFIRAKRLSEQFRTDKPAVFSFDQAAIGLVREEKLAGTVNESADKCRKA